MNWLLPRGRRGAAGRFLLAAIVVILFTAATTAVAGLLDLKQGAQDIARHVVGDILPLKHPHYQRVSIGGERPLSGRLHIHARARY